MKCEMYLLGTMDRCGEPAVFHVASNIVEVRAEERGEGGFCFAHAVKLAAHFLEDGRPEYRITPLEDVARKVAAL